MATGKSQHRVWELLRTRLDLVDEEPRSTRAEADLHGRIEGIPVVIDVQSMGRGSLDDMKGRLAIAVLQSRRTVADLERVMVAMLHVPRIGGRAINGLGAFMREYAPDVGWGVFDDRGTVHLELAEAGIELHQDGRTSEEEISKTTHNRQAFTDLNRWLLKVLLLRDESPKYWRAGEMLLQEIRNPNDLQKVADVSQAKAYQFARTLKALGFLKWERREFRIMRPWMLFEMWYEQERQLHGESIPVRSIYGGEGDPLRLFESAPEDLDYAIGGLAACKLHGVLHAQGSFVPWVHFADDYNQVLEKLDLEVCVEHQAELYLIDRPYKESIFRATAEVDGLRVVDIVQAALDMSHHPGRGREQAEFITRQVMGWR